MKDKVIEILMMPKSEESIQKLCELCGIYEFQASKIIDQYSQLYKYQVEMINSGLDASNMGRQMQDILRGLISGDYASTSNVQNDLKNEVIRLLQTNITEESIVSLSKLSGIDYENAKKLMEQYQTTENYELELMKQGLDASNFTSQKWEIINKLSSLENLNNRKM